MSEYASLFINSSFGIGADVSLNVPVSIFPLATLAGRILWDINDQLALRYAIYDGNPGDPVDDSSFPDADIDSDEGVLNIAELSYANEIFSREAVYKLGFWYHTGEFVQIDDGLMDDGNYGFYLIADQALTEWSGHQLGSFLQLGFSPTDQSFVDFYLGVGLHLQGLLLEREYQFGFGINHASVNDDLENASIVADPLESGETVLEWTMHWQICENIAVQPDLHYIINPGADSHLDDAWVFLFRFEIAIL